MRDLLFKCPSCAASLAFDRGLAGKALSCPACKGRISVPIPDTSFSCPSCNAQLHVPSDAEGEFECPGCGGRIVRTVKLPLTSAPPRPNVAAASPVARQPQARRQVKIKVVSAEEMERGRTARIRSLAAISGCAVLAVLLLVLGGVLLHRFHVSRAYRAALSAARDGNDPEAGIAALQSVLSMYPDARPAASATDRIGQLIDSTYVVALKRADQARTPAEAIKEIEAAIARHPDSIRTGTAKARIAEIVADKKRQDDVLDAAMARARGLIAKGAFDEAESLLDKAVKDNPFAAHVRDSMALADEAKMGRDERKRQDEAVLKSLSEAKELFAKGSFGVVVGRLEEALRDNPLASHTDGIAALLDEARRGLAAERQTGTEEYRNRTKHAKPSEMVEDVRRCAGLGVPEAQRDLAEMYLSGHGLPVDEVKALEWFRMAAEQGDARSQAEMGRASYTGKGAPQDYTEAARWYRKAAEQDEPFGQWSLGHMHEKGYGVAQDHAEAVRWYRKAAEHGDPTGQLCLGRMYQNGTGVQEDDAEAARWYRKAAEQGDPTAQWLLGDMYCQGSGVPQNHSEAAKWLRKAADQGVRLAQYNLGCLYVQGRGVARDYAEARKWLRMAAEQGVAAAEQPLTALALASPCLKRTYEDCRRAYGDSDLKEVRGNVAVSNHEVGGFQVHVVYVNRTAEYLQFSKKGQGGETLPPSDEEQRLIMLANSLGGSWQRGFGGVWVLDTAETVYAATNPAMGFHICTKIGEQAKLVQLDEIRRQIDEYGRR